MNRRKEQQHAWYLKNCEAVKAKARANYAANADRIKAEARAWYAANREQLRRAARERMAKRREADPEGTREYSRRWYAANKDKARAIKLASRARTLWKVRARDRAKSKVKVSTLTDGYVAFRLGLPVHAATPDLIEAKRIQLMVHRITRTRERT